MNKRKVKRRCLQVCSTTALIPQQAAVTKLNGGNQLTLAFRLCLISLRNQSQFGITCVILSTFYYTIASKLETLTRHTDSVHTALSFPPGLGEYRPPVGNSNWLLVYSEILMTFVLFV